MEQSQLAETRGPSESFNFGSMVSALRKRGKHRQSTIAAAANLSPGYYSDLENNKRLAPPPATVSRIAYALELHSIEANRLIALAEAERAAAFISVAMSPDVRRLLTIVLMTGSRLSAKTLASTCATFCEEADRAIER